METLKHYKDYDQNQIAGLSPAIDRYLYLTTKTTTSFSDELRALRHTHWLNAALATHFNTATTKQITNYWSHRAEVIVDKAWDNSGLSSFDVSAFSLGKLGCAELNLSSDIDLVLVSEAPPTKELLRAVKKFTRLISEQTSFGFCFRLDYDLRPNGRLSPIVCTLTELENYYWSQGENWERLALIRLKHLAGKKELSNKVIQIVKPFSFRKHIDRTYIQQLSSIRQQLSKSGDDTLTNIKLCPGGIRDIELYTHALQAIYGGKFTDLQIKPTDEALNKLADLKLIKTEDADLLIQSYWKYRDLEHKAQLKDDQQTHEIKTTKEISEITHYIQNHISSLLPKPEASTTEALTAKKNVIKNILETSNNEPMLAFLKGIKNHSKIFQTLNEHTELLELLKSLFNASPPMAQVFLARPSLVQAFLYKTTTLDKSDEESFYSSLVDLKLLHTIVASSEFLYHLDLFKLHKKCTHTADTIITELIDFLNPNKLTITPLCLGKWGGQEMGLYSDLDFAFITDDQPTQKHHRLAKKILSRLTEQHRGGHIYPVDLRLRPFGDSGLIITSVKSLENFIANESELWQRQAYLKSRFLNSSYFLKYKSNQESDFNELNKIREKLLIKKTSSKTDIKYNPGGLIDIEFNIQYQFLKKGIKPISPNTFTQIDQLISLNQIDAEAGQDLRNNYEFLCVLSQLLQLFHGASTHQVGSQSKGLDNISHKLSLSNMELLTKVGRIMGHNTSLLGLFLPK